MARKPKAPLAAWIIAERKARGWKTAELGEHVGVTDPTVRGWETGRGVSEDNLAALERLFGKTAPDEPEPADMSALVAALDRQTAAISELVSRFDGLATQAIRDGIREALEEAAGGRAGGASPASPRPGQ